MAREMSSFFFLIVKAGWESFRGELWDAFWRDGRERTAEGGRPHITCESPPRNPAAALR
jgi:hypothetical protein